MKKPAALPWPAPNWEPVQPFPFAAARKAFAGMTGTKGRVVLRYFRRPAGDLAAMVEFGPYCEGAPGLVHGGAILTALDEALGAAAWLTGRPVMTARLTTHFRKGVPLGANLVVETRLLSERHHLIFLEGRLVDPAATVYAEAEGRFMLLTEATQRRILGRISRRTENAEKS